MDQIIQVTFLDIAKNVFFFLVIAVTFYARCSVLLSNVYNANNVLHTICAWILSCLLFSSNELLSKEFAFLSCLL